MNHHWTLLGQNVSLYWVAAIALGVNLEYDAREGWCISLGLGLGYLSLCLGEKR